MDRQEIETAMQHDPFVPLRLHLTDRRVLDVPFRHVIVFQKTGLILFKGVKKEGSRIATGYAHLSYEQIERIEFKRGQSHRRRKAS
jgi:hypothetical protein